ncbi:hypothetical protein [Archangium sp.]|uniref:hypothetical protein n=1 Tax=Archangium sp. TaxID=1872627 RepID=UPI00286BD520|nr:hypothetical protein [Archangium sp.]
MAGSDFVSQFRHRALRHLPRAVRPLGLETRLDIRPMRFAVGLERPVHWERLVEAREAPSHAAFYLGRVKEVGEDGVLALAWEYPSGRESLATLSVRDDFGGEPPVPGSLLRIWTWVELPGGDERQPRRKVEVEQPHLSDSARDELKAFLQSLENEDLERTGDET